MKDVGGKDKRLSRHFSTWLRSLTGCSFSNKMVSDARVDYWVQRDDLREADTPHLERFVDDVGDDGTLAVLIFPRVRTVGGIAHLLTSLTSSKRWTLSRVEWGKHPRAGITQIGLRYRTKHGDDSSAMGFAPMGCMPITRRAPYVAIGVWSGAKLNPYKRSPPQKVGLIDAAVPESESEHTVMWDNTVRRVAELLEDPQEDGQRMRNVAFWLPDEHVTELGILRSSVSPEGIAEQLVQPVGDFSKDEDSS